MTAMTNARRLHSRLVQAILFAILPALTLGYQITAKFSANQLAHARFDTAWAMTAIRMPSVQLLIVLEIASFVAWMTVLALLPLSAAFPLSAVSYVLIIAASVVVFHEPLNALQLVGGLMILAGVWMVGRGGAFDAREPAPQKDDAA